GGPRLAAHGAQIESLAALRKRRPIEHREQPAVDAVAPAVEQAREALGVPAAGLAQTVATVHADVVAGGETAVGLADHEHGFGADLEREVVNGVRCIGRAARQEPGWRPHALPPALP